MTTRRRLVRRGEGKGGPEELLVTSSEGRSVEVSGPRGRAVVDCAILPDGRHSVIFPSGRQISGRATRGGDGRVEAWVEGRRLRVDLADPLAELAAHSAEPSTGATVIVAEIPGRVVDVRVVPGDRVEPGATLLVLEAMKMQNEIRAEARSRVETVECRAGQAVDRGTVLARLLVDAPD